MITEMQPGTFPVLEREVNQALFVRHSQAVPHHVVLPDGTRLLSGYVAVSEAPVDLYKLCKNNGEFAELVIEELVYIDEGDNLKVHVLDKMAPTSLVNRPAITIGFVTKLCDLRWGFNLVMNTGSGEAVVHVDDESPIVGLKLRFQ